MLKTLYLWDLAGTLFPEEWNPEAGGFSTFRDYIVSLGKNPDNPRDYEEAFEWPYKKGEPYHLQIIEGFKEVLGWTKHNEAFTTGVKEQMDWRAEYFRPKLGFDIRDYFQDVVSTFEYSNTNIKTMGMLLNYLRKKYQEGYQVVVYTDDKLQNCEFFKTAAEKVKSEYPDFSYRTYHFLNNNDGLLKKDWRWEIGSLYDLLGNEKKILTNWLKSI